MGPRIPRTAAPSLVHFSIRIHLPSPPQTRTPRPLQPGTLKPVAGGEVRLELAVPGVGGPLPAPTPPGASPSRTFL